METVTVSLYKNGYADPKYKHLTKQVYNGNPDFVMNDASVVKVGQKDAVRFDVADGTSYYSYLACKYMDIITKGAGDIWCFIDHIDYVNPKTIFVYYTIDYWHSFDTNKKISGNAFIERSGYYGDDDAIKAPDAAIPSGTPNVLASSSEIYKPSSPKIIVYYRKVTSGNDPVKLSRYDRLDTSKLGTKSYEDSLRNLSEGSLQGLSIVKSGVGYGLDGKFPDLSTLNLGDAKLNVEIPSGNSSSKLCYKVIDYNENGMAELFNSSDIWSATGSTIIGAEIRENYHAPNSDGTYSVKIKDSSPSIPDTIPAYLRKNPFVSYKLESNFGSVELNPSQINPDGVDLEMYDSIYPGSHPIFKVNGYPASSRNGSLSMVDGQDRSINLFTDGFFGHFYAQRNRINAKINNFIRSFNAKIVSIYAGFDAKKNSVNNSNRASILSTDNSQFATDANTRQANSTAVSNLSTSQANSVANLKNSNSVSENNLARTNKTQITNINNTNKKALDSLDSNYDLTNKNLDNTYNTSKKDNEITFDEAMARKSLTSLEALVGAGVAASLNTLLQGVLTGGLDLTTSNAKLDNNINGLGNTPSGEKQRAQDTNSTEKTNLNRTQQAQVTNMGNSQDTSVQNLKDSNKAQVDNLNASNLASSTVLENNNSLKIFNMSNSFRAQYDNTYNSTIVAMANLYNSMAETIQSFLPSAKAEAENFMDTLASEIADYHGASDVVSSGSGFAYDSLKNGRICFNIYRVSDGVLTKAKNYAKTYGLLIGRNKSLETYFKGSISPQLEATGYKNEFYLKTQGARIKCPSTPIQGINEISDALDSGVWIEE